MRGIYKIPGSQPEVVLKFSTWVLYEFGQAVNAPNLYDLLGVVGGKMTTAQLFLLMKLAAKEAKPEGPDYTDREAAGWLDLMGGLAGPGLVAMMSVLSESVSEGSTKEQKQEAQPEGTEDPNGSRPAGSSFSSEPQPQG